MGGDAWARSELRRGSDFYFTAQLAPVSPPTTDQQDQPSPAQRQQGLWFACGGDYDHLYPVPHAAPYGHGGNQGKGKGGNSQAHATVVSVAVDTPSEVVTVCAPPTPACHGDGGDTQQHGRSCVDDGALSHSRAGEAHAATNTAQSETATATTAAGAELAPRIAALSPTPCSSPQTRTAVVATTGAVASGPVPVFGTTPGPLPQNPASAPPLSCAVANTTPLAARRRGSSSGSSGSKASLACAAPGGDGGGGVPQAGDDAKQCGGAEKSDVLVAEDNPLNAKVGIVHGRIVRAR